MCQIPKIGWFGISIALEGFTNIKVKDAVAVGFGFDVKVCLLNPVHTFALTQLNNRSQTPSPSST